MPLFKTTMMFEAGKFGWSESHYREAATYEDAATAAADLRDKRIPILAKGASMTALRVSRPDVFRDAVLLPIPDDQAKLQWLAGDVDQPWNGFLCRKTSTALYQSRILLRGCPDDEMVKGSDKPVTSEFKKKLIAYLRHLSENVWGFLVREREPKIDGADQFGHVQDVDVTNPSNVIVTLNKPFNAANNSRIIIRGVKGPKNVNGVHPVVVVPNTLNRKVRLLKVFDDNDYLEGGVWRWFNLAFVQYDLSEPVIQRVAKRDTGRPSALPVGRRRVRKTA